MKDNFFSKKTVKIPIMVFTIFIIVSTVNSILSMRAKPAILQVSGEGTVLASPDTATITVGVSSEAVDAATASNLSNKKMGQVISFLKASNISAADIKTTEFELHPKYDYSNGKNAIIGYQTSQKISIVLHRIDQSKKLLEKITKDIIKNGANTIQQINFIITHPSLMKQQAQKLAIQNAKEKAAALTKEADLKLGKVINLIEGNSGAIIQPVTSMRAFAASANTNAVTLEPGTQEITENITLLFEVYKK